MRKAKKMPGTKKLDKYIGPVIATEVTDSHALVLVEGTESKCKKIPLHLARPYFPRSDSKILTKRKNIDLPTDVALKKIKVTYSFYYLDEIFRKIVFMNQIIN